MPASANARSIVSSAISCHRKRVISSIEDGAAGFHGRIGKRFVGQVGWGGEALRGHLQGEPYLAACDGHTQICLQLQGQGVIRQRGVSCSQ